MRFLDTLDLYLTESKEPYDLYPVDYDSEDGASFGVDMDDSDNSVAKIIIRALDGTPIDALGASYDYKDVYADILISGDTDDPKNLDLISWVVNKFKKLGYDETSIRVDGEKYYENDSKDSVKLDDSDEDDSKDSEEDYTDYWDKSDDAEAGVNDGDDSIPSTVDASEPFDTDHFDIDKKLSNPELTNTEYELDGESDNDDAVEDSETTGYNGNFPKSKNKKRDKK